MSIYYAQVSIHNIVSSHQCKHCSVKGLMFVLNIRTICYHFITSGIASKFNFLKKYLIIFYTYLIFQADQSAGHHEREPVEGDVEAHARLAFPHTC